MPSVLIRDAIKAVRAISHGMACQIKLYCMFLFHTWASVLLKKAVIKERLNLLSKDSIRLNNGNNHRKHIYQFEVPATFKFLYYKQFCFTE